MAMEIKEAFKGQLGSIGKDVAMVYYISQMRSKVNIQDAVQVCARIEKEQAEELQEYCNERGLKLVSVCNGILNAAVNEFLEYHKSFKALDEELELLVQKQYDEEQVKKVKKSQSPKKPKVALDLTE
jgi:hypothetical protein